jgi:hypothetical protein
MIIKLIIIGILLYLFYGIFMTYKENMENNETETPETVSTSQTNTYDNYNHYDQTSSPTMYYGAYGAYMRVLTNGEEKSILLTYKNEASIPFYYDDNNNIYNGPNNSTITLYQDDSGNYLAEIKNGQTGEISVFTTQMPMDMKIKEECDERLMAKEAKIQGITGSDIIDENKDLYILKTQIIPPIYPQEIDYMSFRKRAKIREEKKKKQGKKGDNKPYPKAFLSDYPGFGM